MLRQKLIINIRLVNLAGFLSLHTGIAICYQCIKYTYSQSCRFSCHAPAVWKALTIPVNSLKTKQRFPSGEPLQIHRKPHRTVQIFKSRLVPSRIVAVRSPHCRWAWPVAEAVSTGDRTPSVTSGGCWTTPFAPGSLPSTSRSDPPDRSWRQKTLDVGQ